MAAARVACLATAGSDQQPHIVPVTFALDERRLVTAIDQKPKSTTRLRRLSNIAENPLVAVLCDRYDEDWTRLWWVRADGRADVAEAGEAREAGLASLLAKYQQYRDDPPRGPVVIITVESWTGWSYEPGSG